MKGTRCLVTGAAGFIGSHLLRALIDQGAQVHAIVRSSTSLGRISDIADRITLHTLDLDHPEAVSDGVLAASPEVVFHLAAETRSGTSSSIAAAAQSLPHYLDPLFNLLSALSALGDPPRVMVRAGTIAEYGASALPYREERREAPLTPYGAGMLAATQYLAMLEPALPFPIVTARLGLTYGPGQSRSFLLPAMLDAARTGTPITIERPADRRDLIYVGDVVEALLLLAQWPQPPCRLVNIATGYAPSMAELAGMIASATGCDPSLFQLREVYPGEVPVELRSSVERARQILGWTANTSLEQGLALTIAAENRASVTMGQSHDR